MATSVATAEAEEAVALVDVATPAREEVIGRPQKLKKNKMARGQMFCSSFDFFRSLPPTPGTHTCTNREDDNPRHPAKAGKALTSFCPEGFVGIGVPIGTDIFVRDFVAKTCRDIIDDVEKLDSIQDGFIHFQLLRFFQDTRLQYINSHIMLNNRCVLQQHHVDCKIADALLKKGTKKHVDDWDTSSKDWAHMVLHLPHVEGGFGVTFNDVTKDAAFYTTTSRFVA